VPDSHKTAIPALGACRLCLQRQTPRKGRAGGPRPSPGAKRTSRRGRMRPAGGSGRAGRRPRACPSRKPLHLPQRARRAGDHREARRCACDAGTAAPSSAPPSRTGLVSLAHARIHTHLHFEACKCLAPKPMQEQRRRVEEAGTRQKGSSSSSSRGGAGGAVRARGPSSTSSSRGHKDEGSFGSDVRAATEVER